MDTSVEAFRLSPQQRRLWTLQLRQAPFEARLVLRLSGPLRAEQLRRALTTVVARHQILHTTFHRLPGRTAPLQTIGAQPALAWEQRDLSDCDPQQLATIAQELHQSEQPAIDLEHGPLLHARLLICAPEQALLLVRLPTLCADTRTLQNIAAQLGQAYHADGDDQEPVQYIQFSEWQNELIEADDDEARAGAAFWQQQQAPVAPLTLPFAQPSSAAGPRAVERAALDAATSAALLAWSQAQELSPAAVLLAAWSVLLWRLSGQPDVTIGALSDGRPHEELEDACGLFAKCMPVRSMLHPALPFSSLAQRLEQTLRSMAEWQDYYVWQASDGRAALPAIGFEYIQQPQPISGALAAEIMQLDARIEPFMLKLTALAAAEQLGLEIEYDRAAFQPDALRYLPQQLQALLASVAADPDAAIQTLELVSTPEQQQLRQLNQTARAHPPLVALHHGFERQVRLTPDAPAVVYEDQQLSYAELNGRANQLARVLVGHGVGPDVCVGISLERSPELIVALLAVLKAGGAFVPLDPSLPTQRLHSMLADIRGRVVLTQTQQQARFEAAGLVVVALDQAWPTIAQQPRDDLDVALAAQNLAYVLFTSGTTSQPKGVCIEHRQILNYLFSISARLDLPAGTSYALISTFAADLGHTVIFPALCSGGCLHIISQERATDAEAVARSFQRQPIDCLKIVPSHLRALLAASEPAQVLPRQRLVLGGEGCPWELAETIQRLAPQCAIINHYGPTETTVGVLTHLLQPDQPRQPSRTLPLSQPVDNTAVYILDAALRPVPVGVAGQLHIGGAALARGYLHRPALTAAAFIPDPFGAEGGRLYTTGDLARRLPDGTIEIVGRIDDQVKFHGYRVELDELRHSLNQHPQIHDSLVVLHAEQQQETLVAYYVARQELDPAELRGLLTQQVVAEVVPHIFMRIARLPLTANGKVDRQQLPSIDEARRQQRQSFVAPRTPVEQTLATIWAEVLGITPIGVHDQFFALGGDSILGIQVIARANQLGVQITPKQLFQHQTIAELALVVNTAAPIQAEQGVLSGSMPLTPIQHWFFEQALPQPDRWAITVTLALPPTLPPALLQQALQQLLAQHDALRTRFRRAAEGWRAELSDQVGALPLPQLDRTAGIEALRAQLYAELSLADGRLVRAAYLTPGADQPAQLLLVIHRLVVDGVSWRLLLEQLATVCTQLQQGQPVTLPPKTTALKHWAERLAAYAQTPALRQEAAFWLALLDVGAAPLPTDQPLAEAAWLTDQAVALSLSREETQALLQEVPAAYQTEINDVLLAALAQTLSGWTGAPHALIALESHGREPLFDDVDLSRTVGWFTALYPVLLTASASEQPGELLKSVKEQLRRIPHHGLGYGLLRYLSPADETIERLRALPQPQIHMRYAGQFQGRVDTTISALDQWEPTQPTRAYLLDVNAAIVDGRLELSWWYSERLYQRATVERLAQSYMAALHTLIAHCRAPEAGGFTASDFPLLDLDQQQLDQLLRKIDKA